MSWNTPDETPEAYINVEFEENDETEEQRTERLTSEYLNRETTKAYNNGFEDGREIGRQDIGHDMQIKVTALDMAVTAFKAGHRDKALVPLAEEFLEFLKHGGEPQDATPTNDQ